MELIVPVVAFGLLVNKAMDLLRAWLPDRLESKFLIPLAMAVGVALAFLFAQSSFATGVPATSTLTLADLDASGLVIFGMLAGAGSGFVNDYKPSRRPAAQVNVVAALPVDPVPGEETLAPRPAAKRPARRR